jgi:hypothetical protein
MSAIEESLVNQNETILDTNNVESVDDESSVNQDETILDTDNNNSNDCLDGLDGLGDFSKKLGSLFTSKDMQSSLANAMNSIMSKMKTQYPSAPNIDVKDLITSQSSLHDEIMNDINTRIAPHLLTYVSESGLQTTGPININEKEKSYGSISMMYTISNHLIKNGHDENEVIRHRDKLIGVYVWAALYGQNDFYGSVNDEISKAFAEGCMGYTTGMLNMGLSSMSDGSFANMFAKFQLSNDDNTNNDNNLTSAN